MKAVVAVLVIVLGLAVCVCGLGGVGAWYRLSSLDAEATVGDLINPEMLAKLLEEPGEPVTTDMLVEPTEIEAVNDQANVIPNETESEPLNAQAEVGDESTDTSLEVAAQPVEGEAGATGSILDVPATSAIDTGVRYRDNFVDETRIETIYTFDVAPGAQIQVQFDNSATSPRNIYVALMQNGDTLAYEYIDPANSSQLTRLLSEAEGGQYHLEIKGQPGVTFEFMVETRLQQDAGLEGDAGNTLAAPREIELEATYQGMIGDNDSDDFYSFTAPAGVQLTVEFTNEATNSRDIYAALLHNGETLVYDYIAPAGTQSLNRLVNSEEGGNYILHIKGAEGGYQFSLNTQSQQDGGVAGDAGSNAGLAVAVSPGSAYTGLVGDNDDVDFYSFTSTGGTISVEVSNDVASNKNIYAELVYNGNNVTYFYLSPGETNSLTADELESGDYFLKIEGTDATYNFQIQ